MLYFLEYIILGNKNKQQQRYNNQNNNTRYNNQQQSRRNNQPNDNIRRQIGAPPIYGSQDPMTIDINNPPIIWIHKIAPDQKINCFTKAVTYTGYDLGRIWHLNLHRAFYLFIQQRRFGKVIDYFIVLWPRYWGDHDTSFQLNHFDPTTENYRGPLGPQTLHRPLSSTSNQSIEAPPSSYNHRFSIRIKLR